MWHCLKIKTTFFAKWILWKTYRARKSDCKGLCLRKRTRDAVRFIIITAWMQIIDITSASLCGHKDKEKSHCKKCNLQHAYIRMKTLFYQNNIYIYKNFFMILSLFYGLSSFFVILPIITCAINIKTWLFE